MNVKMDKCDKQFKPQIYQRNRRVQNRCNYNQNDFWTRNRSFSRDRGTSYTGRGNFVRIIDKIIEGCHKRILEVTKEGGQNK